MSVAGSISGALQRFGRPMTLRRHAVGPNALMVPLDVTVHGRAKNYQPHELVGELRQGDSEITITNAEIAAAQWPGPPRTGDKIVVDGRTRNVEFVEPKYLGAEVLVHVMVVRG